MDEGFILLVEDDVLVRHPLAAYLRECGYRVAEAVNAAEAKALLGGDNFKVDGLLARAPQGFELAAWVRENYPDVQVILAGSVEAEAAKAGDLCEDGPALTLPYEHRFVLERIKILMAARQKAKADQK